MVHEANPKAIKAKSGLGVAPDSVMLNFPTMNDYDSFFSNATFRNSKIATSAYAPLRNRIDELNRIAVLEDSLAWVSSPYLADTIYDNYDLLLDILNEKKLVQLGAYIVRVDLQANTVYTIPASTPHATNIILTNTNHTLIKKYNPEQELTHQIFAKPCGDKFAKIDKDKRFSLCSSKIRTKKELTYQAAGIYFSIVTEVKSEKKSWGIWWNDNNVYPQISNVNFYYKIRCGQTYSVNGTPPVGFPPNSYLTNGHKASFRPYQGITAISSYSLYSTIGYCGGMETLHISSN